MVPSKFANAKGPVQIIKLVEGRFVLDEKQLSDILLRADVRNTNVVVVSIAGELRTGKSFLSCCFVRHLLNERKGNWIGEEKDKISGFKYRYGTERETAGIWMWRQPFLITLPNGEKVAILLIDTQGISDTDSDKTEDSFIFGISFVISSLQIFNVQKKLKSDDLQDIKLFSDFAAMFLQEKIGKPFQRLEILIRDWDNWEEYPFGSDGGKEYLEMNLGKKSQEEVAKHLYDCFEEIGCYLLPDPGKKVTSSKQFTGSISDIKREFVDELKELVLYYFSDSCLKPKRKGGKRLKGKDLLSDIQHYVEVLQNNNRIPKGMSDAALKADIELAFQEVFGKYDNGMEKFVDSNKSHVDERVFKNKHHELLDDSKNFLNGRTILGGEKSRKEVLEKLEKRTEKEKKKYENNNKKLEENSSAGATNVVVEVLKIFLMVMGGCYPVRKLAVKLFGLLGGKLNLAAIMALLDAIEKGSPSGSMLTDQRFPPAIRVALKLLQVYLRTRSGETFLNFSYQLEGGFKSSPRFPSSLRAIYGAHFLG